MARRQYPAIAMEKPIRGIFGTLLEEKKNAGSRLVDMDWFCRGISNTFNYMMDQ